MKRMINGAVIAAGALALASGAALAGAGPASGEIVNEAWGATATGTVTLGPVARAITGSTPQVAANANLPGLLATGVILDRADSTSATASIQGGVVLTLPQHGSLTADGVRASCTAIGTHTIGAVNIPNGSIKQLSRPAVPIAAHPAPNTVVNLAGGGTITLNQESMNNGQLAVTAVVVNLPGQTVRLGFARCSAGIVG